MILFFLIFGGMFFSLVLFVALYTYEATTTVRQIDNELEINDHD